MQNPIGGLIALGCASQFEGELMRSELVFGATHSVANRFLLVKLAAKAIRAFHRPNTRIAETANDVLLRFGLGIPGDAVRRTNVLNWLAS